MNSEVKTGFTIICNVCGSENCSFGTYGGHEKMICNDCEQEVDND